MKSKQRRVRTSSAPLPAGTAVSSTSITVEQALQAAVAAHRAAHFEEAQRLYRAVLRTIPTHPDANHNLGILFLQTHQVDKALALFKTALTSNPKHEQYWLSYINALLHNGQVELARAEMARAQAEGVYGDGLAQLAERIESPSPSELEAVAQLFNEGRFSEVERLSKAMTERCPKHAFGWKVLGAVLTRQGRTEQAVEPMQRAVQLSPADAEALANLGVALKELGRLGEAELAYRKALLIKPDWAQLHYNLGNALLLQGALDEAETCYRHAVERKPDYAAAYSNLGNVLQRQGRLVDAVATYQSALEIDPNFVDALNNLGNSLQETGNSLGALAHLKRAVEIDPENVEVLNNLGRTLKELGRLDEALLCCETALRINPAVAAIHTNMGNILRDRGQFDDAVKSYQDALQIDPDLAEAHNNLGCALKEIGDIFNAVASYERAIRINPQYAVAYSNLGSAQKEVGQFDEAAANFRRALIIKPDFAEALSNLGSTLKDIGRFEEALKCFKDATIIKPDYFDAQSNLLFSSNLLTDLAQGTMLEEAKRYGSMVARHAQPFTEWRGSPDPDRPLRVGLVSGDFRNHAVGHFVEGVVAALNEVAGERLALYCYSTFGRTDELTDRVKACCVGWQLVSGLSDEMLARKIHDDSIDILIDLSGHTAYNRLPAFAWKPAPVQISWLGYFATTGVAEIDYLIADRWVLPASEGGYFTEKIWHLPETRLCFTPPDVDIQVVPLPALRNGNVTFGCFNNLSKMNDEVVALWATVLRQVADSRLLLKAKQLREESVRDGVLARFATHGIGRDRIALEGPESREKYFAAYNRVDIALDPFPYPGGTTSVESLWMGVPVLTLTGDRFLSRQGVGILMNAGLPDWVATDKDDYIAKAVSHAHDVQALAVLREKLRARALASPLFDAPRFARQLDVALREMWRQWCADKMCPTASKVLRCNGTPPAINEKPGSCGLVER